MDSPLSSMPLPAPSSQINPLTLCRKSSLARSLRAITSNGFPAIGVGIPITISSIGSAAFARDTAGTSMGAGLLDSEWNRLSMGLWIVAKDRERSCRRGCWRGESGSDSRASRRNAVRGASCARAASGDWYRRRNESR